MPCFYLTPKQDDFNQELQVCIAEFSRVLSLLVSLAPFQIRGANAPFTLRLIHLPSRGQISAVTDQMRRKPIPPKPAIQISQPRTGWM